MSKPYNLFTQDEIDVMDKEADELCQEFMNLIGSSFITQADDHRAGVWQFILIKLLIHWLENLRGTNEKQTRDYQATQLTKISNAVLRSLANMRAEDAAKNLH